MNCFFCGGPWSESTGHVYSKDSMSGEPRVVSCGPCSRAFYVWLRGWAQRKNKRGLSFYEAAVTSIKPPRS